MTLMNRMHDRRTVLKATAAGMAAATSAGCLGTLGGNDEATDESVDFDGWFSGVSNYDGVVDATGQSETEVLVGAKGNGGSLAYAPAAVKVSTGTTIVWRSKGGMHNVIDSEGAFESEMMSDAGETFSHTFESAGKYTYFCSPHKQMGMKGAVVIE